VTGPRAASIDRIPPAELANLRTQVNLGPVFGPVPQIPRRSSILAGVDAIVDEALGVENVGRTAPHYRHLKAYRAVASGRLLNGPALIQKIYA
jgi:hypothetical protein